MWGDDIAKSPHMARIGGSGMLLLAGLFWCMAGLFWCMVGLFWCIAGLFRLVCHLILTHIGRTMFWTLFFFFIMPQLQQLTGTRRHKPVSFFRYSALKHIILARALILNKGLQLPQHVSCLRCVQAHMTHMPRRHDWYRYKTWLV